MLILHAGRGGFRPLVQLMEHPSSISTERKPGAAPAVIPPGRSSRIPVLHDGNDGGLESHGARTAVDDQGNFCPCKSSYTWEALVGLGLPDRLALGAARAGRSL